MSILETESKKALWSSFPHPGWGFQWWQADIVIYFAETHYWSRLNSYHIGCVIIFTMSWNRFKHLFNLYFHTALAPSVLQLGCRGNHHNMLQPLSSSSYCCVIGCDWSPVCMCVTGGGINLSFSSSPSKWLLMPWPRFESPAEIGILWISLLRLAVTWVCLVTAVNMQFSTLNRHRGCIDLRVISIICI